jgi:GDPmannose 4,6-dehydratase
MKKALITGISGQDGRLLSELLLKKGYKVSGTTRNLKTERIRDFKKCNSSVELFEWDLIDSDRIKMILDKIRPDEIYNMAAFTSGEKMFDDPIGIGLINGIAVTKILDSIKELNLGSRLAQASSSEMFGNPPEVPQNESTVFYPKNPYGIAKLYAHQIIHFYRQRYGIYSSSGILFNHESSYRPHHFVTRKITSTAVKIKLGIESQLILGNLKVKRDWLHAKDAMCGMWLMLQAPSPSDYIIASGVSRTIEEFCQIAFEFLDLDYKDYVVSSPEFFRPMESINLEGNPKKLMSLGWSQSITFEELVREMVENDLLLLTPQASK